MGAAMLSPAILEGCSSGASIPTTPSTNALDPTAVPTVTIATSTATVAVATSTPTAEPTVVTHASERPRGDGTPNSHPTRGFSGGARAR
jgi:hypothetical protein